MLKILENEQNSGEIWKNGCLNLAYPNLAYFTLQRCKYSNKTGLDLHIPIGKQLKDRDTLIEQSPCYELL